MLRNHNKRIQRPTISTISLSVYSVSRVSF